MVWSFMKSKVELKEPKSKDDLIKIIAEIWNSLSANQLKKYINHLKTTIDKILEQNGEFIG